MSSLSTFGANGFGETVFGHMSWFLTCMADYWGACALIVIVIVVVVIALFLLVACHFGALVES